MRFVTSFGPDGYEVYGKRFLESWVKHGPQDAQLFVYVEGWPAEQGGDRVEYRDLFDIPGIQEFLFCCTLPAMQGRIMGGKRNYRYDVSRFCRKSFAQCDAASDYSGPLYWIDADVELTAPVELPEWGEEFMQYLGRPDWHSCASFVGWNCAHPIASEFWRVYYNLYVTGTVFALEEWHDSYVLDWIRHQMKLPARNLAEGLEMKGPANVFDKVFSWGHHYKGNLKFTEATT